MHHPCMQNRFGSDHLKSCPTTASIASYDGASEAQRASTGRHAKYGSTHHTISEHMSQGAPGAWRHGKRFSTRLFHCHLGLNICFSTRTFVKAGKLPRFETLPPKWYSCDVRCIDTMLYEYEIRLIAFLNYVACILDVCCLIPRVCRKASLC